LLSIPGATSSDVDTITIELHNSSSPFALAFTSKGVLKNDGGITCAFAGAQTGSYYIVIKHRTIMDTWSAAPVNISNPYNFATSAGQAYGSQEVSLMDGNYALVSGDITADGSTQGKDGTIDNKDLNVVQKDQGNFIIGTYGVVDDLNGDGIVDECDLNIMVNNIGVNASHP
jgi:hypothetical protein